MNALAVIAGGRREVFEGAPGDRVRYSAMGGVIVSTAVVAAASAAMAMHMAMGLAIPWAVLIGLVWGFIIFNLDRLLVVQMMRQDKRWVSVVAALPRLLLALVLGAVISTPMVLQIFRPEIETELLVMQADKNTEYNRQTAANPEYAQIPGLEQQIKADQALVDKGAPVNVESDPAVTAARRQYDAAQKEYAAAERAVVCEKEGTCGSGKRGAGIAYQEKVQIRNDKRETRDEAERRLTAARQAAQKNLGTAQVTALTAAEARLSDNRAKLADLNDRLAADRRAHEAQTKQDHGLLARLEALNRLSDDRPTLQTAHITLFLLFLALELLPVLMKLLQVLGPETRYEREAELEDDMHAQTAQERRDLTLKIERDIAASSGTAAGPNVARVVKTRAEVMQMALDAWAEQAIEQTKQDLRRWKAQGSGPAFPPPVDPPPADPPTADPPQQPPLYWPAHRAQDDNDPTIPINGFNGTPSPGPQWNGNGNGPVDVGDIPPQRKAPAVHPADED
ncbi:DUF4407 domain-containing protein [Actinoplanes sp. NPDC051633]|uniref:DUF4407 domain-containing protein n=1 Tax=Actinoplanes sp. NPDC051633 TaxID=3155670 RepID=UPI00341B3B43